MALELFSLVGRVHIDLGNSERNLSRLDVEARKVEKTANGTTTSTQKLTSTFRAAPSAVSQFSSSLNSLNSNLLSTTRNSSLLAGVVGGLSAVAVTKLTSSITSGASAWLDYSASIENARISFGVLIGSASQADQHIRELTEFAKSTPFELSGLIDSSRTMQAMGFKAKEIVPLLTDMGNAVAAAGGGAERLERVTKAIADISNKGKVETQELRQLAENGIPAWRVLEEQFGKSRAELVKMVEAGEISSDAFLAAFKKFSQLNFGGLMEKQSRTFLGALSNVKDGLLQASHSSFQPFFEKISEISVRFADELNGVKGMQGVADASADELGRIGGEIADSIVKGFADSVDKKGLLGAITEPLNEPTVFERFGGRMGAEFHKGFLRSWDYLLTGTDLTGAIDLSPKQIKGEFMQLDPKTLKPNTNDPKYQPYAPALANLIGSKDDEKRAEKLRDLVSELSLKTRFFGNDSAAAATQQKLLSLGVTDVNNALARQAMAYATTLDAAQRAADKQQEDFNEQRTNLAELEARRMAATDATLELAAATAGGSSELQKFDAWTQINARKLKGLEEAIKGVRAVIEVQDWSVLYYGAQNVLDETTSAFRRFGSDASDPILKVINNFDAIKGVTVGENTFNGILSAVDRLRDGSYGLEEFDNQIKILAHDMTTLKGDKWLDFAEKLSQSLSGASGIKDKMRFAEVDKNYASILDDLNKQLDRENELTATQITLKRLSALGIGDETDARRENALALATQVDGLRAQEEAQKQLEKTLEQARGNLEKTLEQARGNLLRVSETLTDPLSDSISNGFQDGWRGALSGFKNLLDDMQREALRAKVFDLLKGVFNLEEGDKSKDGKAGTGVKDGFLGALSKALGVNAADAPQIKAVDANTLSHKDNTAAILAFTSNLSTLGGEPNIQAGITSSSGFDLSSLIGGLFTRVFNNRPAATPGFNPDAKDNTPSAIRNAGQEAVNAVTKAGVANGTAVKTTGDATVQGLGSVSQTLLSGLGQIANSIAVGQTRGGFWKGLFTAAAVGALNGALGALGSAVGVGGSGNAGIGGYASGQYATGGFVTGPGTATSDSILAMLSNREYVINAASVSKFGKGFFDQLNAGTMPKLPAFSDGGAVSNFASSYTPASFASPAYTPAPVNARSGGAGGSNSGHTFNNHFDVKVEGGTGTAQQRYRSARQIARETAGFLQAGMRDS